MATDLSRKAKAGGHSRHSGRDQVVEVAVSRCCQFQSAEADVVQSLVVYTERLVGVLDELMD